LYSDEDVALIIKMRDLVKSGTAPAEASRAVLEASNVGHAGAAVETSTPSIVETDPYVAATDRIIDAVCRFDPDALDEAVSKALTLGPAVSIYDRTIGPALVQIGELWHAGAVTVAQEHLASNVLGGTLVHLLRLAQPADTTRRIVLACFADEEHVLGLYGAGLRFASWGYRTLMLGASTPPAAIARIVEALAPELVGLSAAMIVPPPRARELVDAYADACHSTPWLVGGGASESMRTWIENRGGLCIGRDLSGARQAIEKAVLANNRKRLARNE
jgi:methanogenic corrinoid protein MtbC1